MKKITKVALASLALVMTSLSAFAMCTGPNCPQGSSDNTYQQGYIPQRGFNEGSYRDNAYPQGTVPQRGFNEGSYRQADTQNQGTYSQRIGRYFGGGTENTPNGGTTASTADDVAFKVRRTLQSDHSLSPSARNIQVSVDAGRVSLSGTVANDAEKVRVESMVKKVDGVKNVVSNLTVSSQ